MPTDSTRALTARLTSTLRDYLRGGRRSTDLLRSMAEDIVELRSRFTTTNGLTDWAGRSRDYRALISDVYSEAGVDPEIMDTVQSALRYHVGNLVRERADREALEDAGIRSVAPRARSINHRRLAAAQLAELGGAQPMTLVRRLGLAEGILGTIRPTMLSDLDVADLLLVSETLDSIAREVAALQRELPKQRRGG